MAIEVGDPKKVLCGRELPGEWRGESEEGEQEEEEEEEEEERRTRSGFEGKFNNTTLTRWGIILLRS